MSGATLAALAIVCAQALMIAFLFRVERAFRQMAGQVASAHAANVDMQRFNADLLSRLEQMERIISAPSSHSHSRTMPS